MPYEEHVADKICERLAEGEPLIAICRAEGLPNRTTVNRWMLDNEEFASRIARARDLGQDFSIDECREIADKATPEDVNVAKLRIWQRQWEASKRAQKRFGDKVQQEVSGKDGGPIQASIIVEFIKP